MKKYRMKASNSIYDARWTKVNKSSSGNHTTNSVITPAMFNRECKEYDAGVLPNEHERYLGEANE